MKKRIGLLAIAMVFVACAMMLAACDDGNPLATQLPVPQNVRVENSTLHWDTVDNASNYLVAVDGVTTQTSGNTYSLSSLTELKTYELKVKALGNTLTYTDSDWSTAVDYVVDDESEIIDAETPSITTQPVGTTYDHNATAAALTVSATSSDSGILSYQWYSNATNSTTGGTAVGADSNSYTPSTAAVGTLYYYVVITNTNDSVNGVKTATVTSNIISITVSAINETINAETPSITTQPVGTTYDHNATAAALTVSATSSDSGILSYQWYSNSTNSTTGGTAVGADSNSYTPSTATVGTLYYYVVITNTNDSVNGVKTATATSNIISITVNAITINAETPNITTQPLGATYDNNAVATALTVTASVSDGGILSFQWYKNTTNSTTGGTEVGTDSNSFTPSTATVGTLYYYVVITNTNDSVNGVKSATTTSNIVAISVIISNGNEIVSANGFAFVGTTGSSAVSNTTDSFSFNGVITVSTNATWKVYRNMDGTNEVPTRTISLEVGDNTVYILVIAQNGADMTLYTMTVRRRPIYSVTFNSNGGTAVEAQNIEEDSFAADPGNNATTKTGYTFSAWDYDFDTPITSNTEIDAQWTANAYTITYNANKPANASGTVTGSTTSTSHIYDTARNLNGALLLTGWTFDCWKDGDNNTYAAGQSVANFTAVDGESIELFAQWTANAYTITYNADKPADASGTVTGSTTSTSHTYDTARNLNGALLLTGWTFSGWKDGEGSEYDASESVINLTAVDGDTIELFAQWTANEYTITYNANKPDNASSTVTGSTISTSHIYDTARNLNGALSLTGWTFVAWKSSEGNLYTAGQSVANFTAVDGDSIELFAQWTANTLTITYDGNKPSTASGTISQTIIDSTHFYDTASDLSNNIFTLTGWTFDGWNTQSDGQGDSYADQAEIANSIKENGGNLILYAQWTANSYLVTYAYEGATDGNMEENKLVEFDELFTLASPSKSPYSFGGWYTEIGGGGTQITDSSGSNLQKWNIADDITLYAYWKGTEGLAYSLSGDTYSVSKGTANTNGEVAIPEYYNGLKVTSIGRNAFFECSLLTSISIPNSVTSIGYSAFMYCTSLTSIAIPNSVTSIGSGAFLGCHSLTEVTIPSSITSIAADVFRGCSSLTEIAIPSSVTSIGESAFLACGGLTEVTIPSSVTSIGESAFNGCNSLANITMQGSTPPTLGNYAIPSNIIIFVPNSAVSAYKSASGWSSCASRIYSIDTVGGDFYIVDNVLIKYFGNGGNITIPSGVTSIGDYAFYYCNSLTEVAIPSSVASIGDYAFYGCSSLTSITIPSSATSIGNFAFRDCTSLTSITIPSSVTSIGERAFFNCTSLSAVYISDIEAWCAIDFVDSLSNPLYYAKNLYINQVLVTDLVIPHSITSIGSFAFSGCGSITSITIPSSVTRIGEGAFSGCSNLTSITLPFVGNALSGSNKTHFGYIFGASSYSNNTSYVPTSLKTVIITGGSSIITAAFYNCSSITSITIPNSVTSIGTDAFYGCSSLTNIIMQGSIPPTLGSSVIPSNAIIFVPNSTVSTYNTASGWSNYSSRIYSVDSIDGDFYIIDNVLIKYIGIGGNATIPSNVTSIGTYAFRNCSGLTSITIPNSVASIGSYAFYNCSALTSVTFEAGSQITSISDSVFEGCSSLTGITIPSSVTSISTSAFAGCSSLTGIIIPSSVTSIGEYALAYCSSLTSITIPSSVTSISSNAFRDCSSLTSITIPSSVTSIGSYAFYNCVRLTIYTEVTSKPSDWNYYWNTSSRPVVWGCTLAGDEEYSYVVSFIKNNNSISYPTATNGIKAPQRTGYTFGGWATSEENVTNGISSYSAADVNSASNSTTLYAIWIAN